MPQATKYDVIVIGTSQGGRFLPIEFAKAGRKVAVIERGPVGGVCVNFGCTPTKTMVASARVAYLAKRAAEYGVHTGPISVDLHAVRKRKQAMVEGARNYFENLLAAMREVDLDLLRGEAHFVAPKTLKVSLNDGETRDITAPLIFINTGARPKQLTVKGVESVSVLDSSTIMELDSLPEHLLIIGGGYIQVSEQLETNVPGIYALGDVKGGPAFTHVTYDDFRILRTNLLDHGHASTRDRVVPHTIFIDPQFGRVGMSENEARKQERNIRVAKLPMNAVIRAIETGETRGLMKAIVDADTQQILGCAILGLEGGEIMTIIQVAMMGKLPYTALREGIFTHPTLAEGLNALFTTLDS